MVAIFGTSVSSSPEKYCYRILVYAISRSLCITSITTRTHFKIVTGGGGVPVVVVVVAVPPPPLSCTVELVSGWECGVIKTYTTVLLIKNFPDCYKIVSPIWPHKPCLHEIHRFLIPFYSRVAQQQLRSGDCDGHRNSTVVGSLGMCQTPILF